MPISLTCPGCKKTLKVADKLAGKRAKCPGCQTPITIPNLTTTETAPGSVPAAVPTKKPILDEDFGLAPLDDDPIPKPVPVIKKPAVAPAQPAAKNPAAPTAPTAAPKPKAPAAKPPTNDPDEFGLAPLGDDLFPAAPVPAKPAAAASKTGSAQKPTAKIPVAASADDEEQNFQLAPLPDLSSDLLGAADPLGAAVPMTAGTLPNQSNPYRAPQASLASSASITGTLPVWKTTKECLSSYSQHFGHGIVFGFKAMGVLLGMAVLVYVVFFIMGKLFESAQPSLDTAYYIFWSVVGVLGICWFLVQCWLMKSLLYFGYCIAKQDYNGAENALNSPGSFLQFVLASVLNCIPIAVIYFLISFVVLETHWATAIPGFLLLSAAANFIGLSLLFFFEYEASCLTIFNYWQRIVVPHGLNYLLTVMLCTLVGLVIQIILIFGAAMAFGATQAALSRLSPDPRIARILAGSIFYAVLFGVVGAYYSIMQGVCFRRMMRLYRNSQDDE